MVWFRLAVIEKFSRPLREKKQDSKFYTTWGFGGGAGVSMHFMQADIG